ncbi:hypothetical protein BKA69DRAFT_1090354, partial [Paraphysoderma sedebokerense]
FFYNPRRYQLTASPICSIPNQQTFCHLEKNRMLYLFPNSDSQSICDLPDGSISFPSGVIAMILEAFGKPELLKFWEEELERRVKDAKKMKKAEREKLRAEKQRQ